MARKIVNRKALREEVEAAERSASADKQADDKAGEKKVVKKKAAKRKSRSAEAKVVRVKLFWLVVNQSGKQVGSRFEYHQKTAAQKKAEELSQGGKSPHWVQKHREPITEA
jgi:hypothetical protein